MEHHNEKDDLKNQFDQMKEDSINQLEHLLGKCRALLSELRRRDEEEDEDFLVGASIPDVAAIEKEDC